MIWIEVDAAVEEKPVRPAQPVDEPIPRNAAQSSFLNNDSANRAGRFPNGFDPFKDRFEDRFDAAAFDQIASDTVPQ